MPHFFRRAVLCVILSGLGASAGLTAHARAAHDDEAASGALSSAYSSGRVGFSVDVRDGVEVDYEVFTLLIEPGEALRFTASEAVRWSSSDLKLERTGAILDMKGPSAPGLSVIFAESPRGGLMRLNLLTMQGELAPGEHAIDGYRIGRYPEEPYRGHAAYLPPERFLEVPPELAGLRISPHFTLGQFLCKQVSDGDPYLILNAKLLLKLERILEAANARGWRADTFHVMSGYRTPAYNASIGNGDYSRHIYGGAADIFIDHDRNGVMDDLNGDGRTDRADAAALFDLVETLTRTPGFSALKGGLGEYDANSAHGPFVHVDERGWAARWGR